jgi:hypothetical protein
VNPSKVFYKALLGFLFNGNTKKRRRRIKMAQEEMVQTILREFVELQEKEGIRLEIVREGTLLEIAEEKIKKLELIAEKLIGLLLHNNRRKLNEIRWELAAYYQYRGFPTSQVWKGFVIVPIVEDKFFVIVVETA